MATTRVAPLQLITDTHLQQRYTHVELMQCAIAAGVPLVQYRDKRNDDSYHRTQLTEMLRLRQGTGTRLIVNDYLYLAVELGADGVHLGQGDPLPADALALLPADAIVGVTVHNADELKAVQHLHITYIGVGPVFSTQSKKIGLPPLGLEALRKIVSLSSHPVVAIGSITQQNTHEVWATGAQGVAVLSAFCAAPNPEAAASSLLACVPGRLL